MPVRKQQVNVKVDYENSYMYHHFYASYYIGKIISVHNIRITIEVKSNSLSKLGPCEDIIIDGLFEKYLITGDNAKGDFS